MKGVQRGLASKEGCSRGSTTPNERRSGEDVFCLQKDYRAKRSGLLIEQTEFSCLPDGLYSVLHPQFCEDIANMAFDGIDGNHQLLPNLLIGSAACNQLENLQFSLTQRLWKWLGLCSLSCLRICHTLLLKGGQQGVQIGSRPMLAFPNLALIQESVPHRVHSTRVGYWLGRARAILHQARHFLVAVLFLHPLHGTA